MSISFSVFQDLLKRSIGACGKIISACLLFCFGQDSLFYQKRRAFGRQFLLVAFLCILLIFNIDENVALWARTLPDGVRAFFNSITHVGKSDPYLVCLIPLSAYWMWITPIKIFARRAFFTALSVAGAGIFVNLIKITFGRARPGLHFGDPDWAGFNWFEFTGKLQSFPSGHTSTVIAVAVCLFLFFPRLKWVWLFLALLMSVSRIVVGAHFPADLVAGTYATILFMIWLNERFEKAGAPLQLNRSFPFIPGGGMSKAS